MRFIDEAYQKHTVFANLERYAVFYKSLAPFLYSRSSRLERGLSVTSTHTYSPRFGEPWLGAIPFCVASFPRFLGMHDRW